VSCIAFALSVIFVVIVFMNIFEDWVASLFTSDPEDIYYIKQVLGIVGFYFIADVIHGVQSGNVRGLGKQFVASIVTLGCYYLFGMPLAVYLGFSLGMDLLGFWGGFLVAITILDAIVIYIVVKADWTLAESKAKQAAVANDATDDYTRLTSDNEAHSNSEGQKGISKGIN
jgi:multidrug resistance protein, MATE family